MASQRRRDAIAAGLSVENAEASRRRRRAAASIMREELAIEMWAQGKTSRQISQALFDRYGVRLSSNIPELVRRGLYRRVQEGVTEGRHEAARELFREYYMQLLRTWMPRALEREDPVTGETIPPDPRAADITMRILRDYGIVERVVEPARSGDINLNVISGVQLDNVEARNQVLASLKAEREKQLVVEGTLVGTPAVEADEDEDGKTPPPPLPKRPD